MIHDQHAAFATLVERFEDMALAVALPACEDVEAARDACQEAFLVAWWLLPRLREPAAFGAWLKSLIRTQCARDGRISHFIYYEFGRRLGVAHKVGATRSNRTPV